MDIAKPMNEGNAIIEQASPDAEDAARERRAKRYARLHRRLDLAGWLLNALLLVLLLAAGWTKELRDVAYGVASARPLALLVYLAMIGAIFQVAGLPLDFYGGYVVEKRFGLSRMTLGGWIKDSLKSLGVGAVLAAGLGELFYWALQAHPETWWMVVAVALILFAVLMAQLAPVLLFPIFFKFRPIENEELVERVRRLGERSGARVSKVLEWKLGEKTSKANAALTGWGATRRVLLADTLLERHNPEEIETIVAHELGHHVHRDIPMAIVVQSVLVVLSLWVVNAVLLWATPLFEFHGLGDFANLPLVLLVVTGVTLVALPAVNGYSRWRERNADRFALELTKNPDAFISAMRKLAEQNLAESQPSRVVEFLFHGHPSIAKRIAYAEQVQR
jgi:STE24 endopeptidase